MCDLATQGCTEDGGNFSVWNFYAAFSCVFSSIYYVYVPVCLIFIFILFNMVNDVVDAYVSNSITYITKISNMSEAFAAVTLLALANGAGNVITSIVV